MSLRYSKKIIDKLGCTHSIDNLVIEYCVKSYAVDFVFDSLSQIFSKCLSEWSLDTHSKKDRLPSSKYQYFRSAIWGGGFDIQYGHYQDYDRLTREWSVFPLLRVKFNPNKYLDSALSRHLLAWLSEWCDSGVLVKFDYAVDILCRPCDLVVFSRKEYGLHKGTRYFGQRNKHGRLKVYDKRAESELDYDLTRCEWTFCCRKPISFDDVLWLTSGPAPIPDVTELGKQSYTLARMLLRIRALGGDPLEEFNLLDYRTRKKLEPYTIGVGVRLFECDCSCLKELLAYYCASFSVSFRSTGVNPIEFGSDFQRLSADDLEDDSLPF